MKRRLRWAAIPIGIAAVVALSACTPTEQAGFLPGFDGEGFVTNHTEKVMSLWVNSWIVLLIVGALTWGLMGWAMVMYRRRKGQTGLPVQMRYNMPIEIFYTVVPLILIFGFFFFTATGQAEIEAYDEDPDVVVTAIGKQWAFDFQYEREGAEPVHEFGIQAQYNEDGTIDMENVPTLYLPVNKTVRIDLTSNDTIHSFWVVDFLYKKDMYIGHDNSWSFTPTREGVYAGKCAELCGEYHSLMLFNVAVVSEAEYEAHLASLEAQGNVGDITNYKRFNNAPGNGATDEAGH